MKNRELFYRQLYLIRRVEEEIIKVYPTDKVKSPVHLSIGQEAVSVGVCMALGGSDIVFGTYRSHALYLAKGGDLKGMIAELYGKATGCAKGKGGSMHLVDVSAGVMGTSAVVATTIPQSVGYAFGLQYQKSNRVVASFFGDGACEEGVFHESMNFAALKKLPIIFVCENNGYAIHSKQVSRQSFGSISDFVKAYGIKGLQSKTDDVFSVYKLASKAVSEIKKKKNGPWFLECETYRYKEHVGPGDDFSAGYRSEAEARPWFKRDQVMKVGKLLAAKHRIKIESEVEAQIREAFEFAENSPFPDPAELYTDVFKETVA